MNADVKMKFMKKGIYLIAALMFVACTQSEKTDIESNGKTEQTKTQKKEPNRAKRDSVEVKKPTESAIPMASFNGSWFRVEYPTNFSVSPSGPVDKYDDYEFVSTDEARFTSPDGTVEFFVFSPQWGGDPKNYLIQQSNEITVESSEEKANSDDPFAVSHRWVTYEDKNGKYTRSYHSLMTESTHHVFGIKYTDRKMYERYKAAYLAFKSSLQQFAD